MHLMAVYSAEQKALMIRRLGEGKTWDQIAAELGRSSEALQRAARRMRKRNEWPSSSDAPREQPDGPGRPRNKVQSRSISPRFSPDIAQALRAVSKSADVRIGVVLSTAITREIGRLNKRALDKTPLGLDPGKTEKLYDGSRSETIAAFVPLDDYKTFVKLAAKNEGWTPAYAVTIACHRLLTDLNYVIVPLQENP
jgi:hypothetical protein